MKRQLYLGLMSGTSLDGVDAALVDLSGEKPRVLGTHFAAFDDGLRARFLALQESGPDELALASLAANALARAYAVAVDAVLRSANVSPEAVRAIGAHGQTVRHRPDLGFTVQLGNPALLAELSGIDVVADFRSRDVAAGGQGAPLAPAFHRAVFGAPGETRAVLNLGGIANVTLLRPDGSVAGFDTGPANVLLDLWCERHCGTRLDAGGAWAASGKVLPELLRDLLDEPFFSSPPPKSTGRDLFNERWLDQNLAGFRAALPQDVQATLAELTAKSVSGALAGQDIRAVYLCGGGAHNDDLRSRLERALRPARVHTTAVLGVPPDWVEAVAFAWLAARHVAGVAANLPQVTGAAGERVLGALWPAR